MPEVGCDKGNWTRLGEIKRLQGTVIIIGETELVKLESAESMV